MSSTTGILPALPQATTAAQTGNTKPVTAPKPATAAAPTSGTSEAEGDSNSTTASKSSAPSPFGPAVKVTLSPEATSILAAATGSSATE